MAHDKIYIIDDDDFFRSTMQLVFRSAGFAVETFASAPAFLANPPPADASACLILDLRMPEMSGLEMLQRLRERGNDVPVIVYTGNADVESAVRAMRKGAFTVIQKPFSNELLIEQVREAITSGQRIRRRRAAIRDAQHKLAVLTERELSIARELSTGKSAREVASTLGLSSRTVEAHRANIFRKGDLNSSVALARLILLAEFGDD